jgi:hypothetical protein
MSLWKEHNNEQREDSKQPSYVESFPRDAAASDKPPAVPEVFELQESTHKPHNQSAPWTFGAGTPGFINS